MAPGPAENNTNPLASRRVRLLMRAAALASIWERVWPRLLPALATVGLFLAVALLDVLPGLPFAVHVSVLAIFAGMSGYTLRGLLIGDYHTDERATRDRLERDSNLQHRPLTALVDQPLSGQIDAGGRVLWELHLRRMAAVIGKLRVRLPSPGMAALDPFGMRAAVLLIMVIAAAAGATDARALLVRALVPQSAAIAQAQLSLDVWITPPAYTGLAPIFLERQKTPPPPLAAAASQSTGSPSDVPATIEPVAITIPVGSTFLAQMGALDDVAEISIGQRVVTFERFDEGETKSGARVEGMFQPADAGPNKLSVSVAGRVVAAWSVLVAADKVPEAEFLAPAKNLGRGLLGVEFEARDDYGLTGVGMAIRHSDGWAVPGAGKDVLIDLPVPGLGTPQAKGTSTQDLSAHPWAGEIVKLSLYATDGAKQRGESDPITLALPQRIFNHPVARAIVAARKKLNRPEAGAIDAAAKDLDTIARQPQQFFDDTVVFLALRIARARLAHDGTEMAVASVQKLLWETALRIEDGEFSIADRELRDAQKRLSEAMKNGADAQELDRLMNELQQALDKYMAALAEHLARQGLSEMPQNPTTRMMEGGDLQKMLDQIKELSRTGAVDAAKRMLSQLNQMLDAIRNGARMAQQPRGMNKGRRALQGLRDLTRRQQELLDRTFRQSQQNRRQGQQGQQGQQNQQRQGQQGQRQQGQRNRPGEHGKMAGEQEALRRELGRMMLQMDEILGAIPPSMGKADRAMKGAGKALQKGDGEGAVPLQTEALDQLRQATEGMAEQLARRMHGSMGMSLGRNGQQMPRGRDPFGRQRGQGAGGGVENGDVKIPGRMELRRSRQILDELRRRSGERDRPALELDYIDRLIRRF